MAASAPTYAAIIETSTIDNIVQFGFAGSSGTAVPVGTVVTHRLGDGTDGYVSEMGVDLTSHLDAGGGFSFLQNAYCIGICSIRMQTIVTFTLFNSGPDVANLRFDSVITPGHLAQLGGFGTGSDGSFSFVVQQIDPIASVGHQLYHAFGATNDGFPILDNAPLTFNGQNHDDNGSQWQVIDWSATNLNVDLLPIPPGETHQFRYISVLTISSFSLCSEVTDCGGIQIAFGDPRNSGGGTTARSTPSAPVIGREFDAYHYMPAAGATSDFVPQTTPKPAAEPEVEPAVVYRPTFTSQIPTVPEPGTWAMLILGFAASGGALRRRQALTRL